MITRRVGDRVEFMLATGVVASGVIVVVADGTAIVASGDGTKHWTVVLPQYEESGAAP
jgi:hypothetical protein